MIDGIDFINLPAEEYWTSQSKKINPRELARTLVFSGDYIGARKVDGHHYRFILDGEDVRLQGRTPGVSGEHINKINWVPHIEKELIKLPNGTVLVGELYFPEREGSKNVTTIMGCLLAKAISRQQKEKLHYYIFDILAWNGKSLLDVPLENRINDYLNKLNINNEYIHIAEYYEGEKLWSCILETLSSGQEGVVIQKKSGGYAPGLRTAYKTLKIKKEIKLEIDAFLTGNIKPPTINYEGKNPENWKYWYNERTGEFLEGEQNYDTFFMGGPIVPITKDFYFGLPGSVEFGVLDKDGKDVSLCWIRGITDELKWEIRNSPNNCRGKVAKIMAMEIDNESGKLRHSKIKEWRLPEDMDMTKCTLDKIPK